MPLRRASGLLPVLLLLSLAAPALRAQPAPAGRWEGAIEIPGSPLRVLVELAATAGGAWSGAIDIPAQNAKGLPLSGIEVSGEQLRFAISGVPGSPTFTGTLAADGRAIAGSFTQGGRTFPFRLAPAPAPGAGAPAGRTAALDSLRAAIPRWMADWKVPGLAIAVVTGEGVLLEEGFGYRNVEEREPVTPHTLFAIGSSTKAITTFVLARLVEDGRLEWDAPVGRYLPDFRLQDDEATRRLTVRDLVTHVSGLPRHDLLWYNAPGTRRELFERLRYLEPSAGLREKWQYQNLMYMTAGYLAEVVSGKSWETLVRDWVFAPLGMTRSGFTAEAVERDGDAALPYGGGREEIERIPYYRAMDAIGPAGSIFSTVREMAGWVRLNLNRGRLGEGRLLSEAGMQALHTPTVVVSGISPDEELPFTLYAPGWFVQAYRGKLLVQHGGNIDGFSALVGFLPKDDLGFVILTNKDGTPLPAIVLRAAADRLLGLEPAEWNARLLARATQAEAQRPEDEAARVEGTRPAHPPADYAGDYEHPAYGTLRVTHAGGRLRIGFNAIEAPLEHWHYEFFSVDAPDRPFDDTKVHFLTNLKGDVDRVALPLERAVEDVVFTRRAPAALSDPAYLSRFAGIYDIGGTAITIALQGSRLTMTVPGQPVYELEPYRENEFNTKKLKGYSVRFVVEDGRVTALQTVQPNGTFTAPRRL